MVAFVREHCSRVCCSVGTFVGTQPEVQQWEQRQMAEGRVAAQPSCRWAHCLRALAPLCFCCLLHGSAVLVLLQHACIRVYMQMSSCWLLSVLAISLWYGAAASAAAHHTITHSSHSINMLLLLLMRCGLMSASNHHVAVTCCLSPLLPCSTMSPTTFIYLANQVELCSPISPGHPLLPLARSSRRH
jgi:hypothetical protein